MESSEFIIVWNGAMDREGSCPSLTGTRETKKTGFWTPPPRLYNKKSEYWKKSRGKTEAKG